MTRSEAEQQVYRTTTVGQLVGALVECRDQTDICYVFENHQGGTLGFESACQRLGISKADWDYANNEAGFYALVGIVGQQLGVPRYDPAASKARRETLIGVMKSPEAANHRHEQMDKAPKDRTRYKLVGDKIITYYADNGSYCLVAYDTVNKKASEPLARSSSREEIERMVANYDDGKKRVEKAATRKIREMFVARPNHQGRAPRAPELER
jgi:murein DD-endopeptidase MepM/ murein hydrolase activator NlpD